MRPGQPSADWKSSTTAALDPVVLKAREQVRQMFADGSLDPDKVPEDAALRGILVNNLFTVVVKERFKIEADA